ncbi:TPA: hypothetical protein ACHOQS_RS16515 [Escherichia coli]
MADFGSTKQTVTFEITQSYAVEMPPMRKHGVLIMKQEKLRLKHIVMNGERINHD